MIAIHIPKTKYHSGVMARHVAYALDECYGSRNKETLFGQTKNGPAIALIGAIGTISTGMAMTGFMGGLMIAGGIASGLGAITGSKFLSTIGMGMSVVGGIGGAFTDVGGSFVNPFSEGHSFAETNLGNAFASLKGTATDMVSTPTAADSLGVSGDAISSNIVDTANVSNQAFSGAGVGTLEGAAGSAGEALGTAASSTSKGGLLSTIMGNKDLVAGVGGAADAYMKYQENKDLQPVREAQASNLNANADATNAQTQLMQDRYNNMQEQPNSGIGVNSNAQIFNQNNSNTAGKYAVSTPDGVKYLTAAEYQALKQQQQQQGLLAANQNQGTA